MKLGLGLALSKSRRTGKGRDPLAGLFNLLRLQTTDKRTLMPPMEYIEISGAGDNTVNARYYFQYERENGAKDWHEPTQQRVLTWSKEGDYSTAADNRFYITQYGTGLGKYRSTNAVPSGEISEVEAWEVILDGEAPAPSSANEGLEPRDYKDCIVLSDAGNPQVNTRYYRQSSTRWVGVGSDGNVKSLNFIAPVRWIISDGPNETNGTWLYYADEPVELPSDVTQWTVHEGASPAPAVTYLAEPQYKPLGINPVLDGANATWTDEISGTGQASQSGAIQRFLTKYEAGVPMLNADGSDDWMETNIESQAIDGAGSFLAVFKQLFGTDFASPVGGISGGPTFCTSSMASSFGLGAAGVFAPVSPVPVFQNTWVSAAVTWSGSNFRYHIINTGDPVRTGTLPNSFDSSAGKVPIGRHGSDYSFFSGRYIAVAIGDKYLSADQLQKAAEFGATLFPGA